MHRSYLLQSQRLGFAAWEDGDVALAVALWGDSRVTRWIGGPFSEDAIRTRLQREVDSQVAHGMQYWPLFQLSDGAHVGCCGLHPMADEPGQLEIGFHLRFEHWGQGYAPEAARTAIRHAFAALGARQLFAGHHPDNQASRAVLARLGFRYTHDAYYGPTRMLHASYLLTADEFRQAEAATGPGRT